jgi:hypothetical protein
VETEVRLIPVTHIYKTVQSTDLVRHFDKKWRGSSSCITSNFFRHSIYSRIPPVTDSITNNIALCTFNIMSIAFTHKWKFTVNATHPVIYMRFFFTLMTKTLPRQFESCFELLINIFNCWRFFPICISFIYSPSLQDMFF